MGDADGDAYAPLLSADRRKLSKRRHPAIAYYRDSGYLPDAFVNFLTLMGYSMEDEKEIYTLEEIIASFSMEKIGRSGAFFDHQKLDWMNQHYMMHTIPEHALWDRISGWALPLEKMQKMMPLVHTRMKSFGEFFSLCHFLFVQKVPLSVEAAPKRLAPQRADPPDVIWEMVTRRAKASRRPPVRWLFSSASTIRMSWRSSSSR